MNPQNYSCEIFVPLSPKEALEGICDVGGWWAADYKGRTSKLNDRFTVRFGDTFADYTVTEYVAGKRMVWQVTDCHLHLLKDKKEWQDNNIIWDISEEKNTTRIHMIHDGLVPAKECYNDCVGGWNFFVKESLYKLLTEKKGLPGIGIRSTISNGDRTYKGMLFSKHDPLPDFQGNYILVDVKEIKVEHVISSNAVYTLDRTGFDGGNLLGAHYMIIENKPVYGNMDPLEDLMETVNNE